MAKNIGLYDVRIDYNMGEKLFGTSRQSKTDLLGVNFVSNLMAEKLFLRLKTDVDVSSESQQRGLQFTEFEINYYIFKQMTINFYNIQEYGSNAEFSPRFSLKFSHAF